MNDSQNSSLNLSYPNDGTKSSQLQKLISTIRQSKKIFIGTYTERRYVESISGYRDIVVVNKEEDDLISCLREIQRVIRIEFSQQKWLGITCNMVDDKIQNYNLWVELEQVLFGKHWFQIRSLKVKDNAVQLQLKYLRPFQAQEREYLDDGNHPTFDLKEILTFENFCGAVKFMAVLIMSIITLSGNLLWHASDYSLKLTRELSILITTLTPVVLGLYDLVAKCIGGIYWLIYMLFQRNPKRPIGPPPLALMSKNQGASEYRGIYRHNQGRF